MQKKPFYDPPVVKTSGLRLEKSFCGSNTALDNTIYFVDMGVNDYSGCWEEE